MEFRIREGSEINEYKSDMEYTAELVAAISKGELEFIPIRKGIFVHKKYIVSFNIKKHHPCE